MFCLKCVEFSFVLYRIFFHFILFYYFVATVFRVAIRKIIRIAHLVSSSHNTCMAALGGGGGGSRFQAQTGSGG